MIKSHHLLQTMHVGFWVRAGSIMLTFSSSSNYPVWQVLDTVLCTATLLGITVGLTQRNASMFAGQQKGCMLTPYNARCGSRQPGYSRIRRDHRCAHVPALPPVRAMLQTSFSVSRYFKALLEPCCVLFVPCRSVRCRCWVGHCVDQQRYLPVCWPPTCTKECYLYYSLCFNHQ